MNETYKFLQKTITQNWKNKTDEEICKLYQETGMNELISYMFCNNFSFLKSLLNKYGFFINEDEKASYILEFLEKSMSTYSNEKNTKFLTHAYIIIRNNLIVKNKHYGCKKIIERNTISYDNIVDKENSNMGMSSNEENIFLNVFEDKNSRFVDGLIVEEDFNNNFNLNEKEKNICNLILKGVAVNKLEISEGLNKNRLSVYNYIKKLKNKIIASDEYLRSR